MAEITIPTNVVEEPLTSGGRDFPAGTWQGEIEEVRTRAFPDWVNQKQGYEHEDGEILSLQYGGAEALEEGQDDPGNLKCFDDFIVRDGDINVWQVDPDADETHWQMQRSWRKLAQLGGALGAATSNGSSGYSLDMEAFIEGLRSGVYDGVLVGFVTFHRPWKSKKTGNEGVEVVVSQYLAAG